MIIPAVEAMQSAVTNGSIKPVKLALHPESIGYTVTLPGNNCKDAKSHTFSYHDTEFLNAVEHQEIPHYLMDVFENCGSKVFWMGCILLEVEDNRMSEETIKTSVVLRPHTASILSDLNQLRSQLGNHSYNDLLCLESQLFQLVNDGCLNFDTSDPLDSTPANYVNEQEQQAPNSELTAEEIAAIPSGAENMQDSNEDAKLPPSRDNLSPTEQEPSSSNSNTDRGNISPTVAVFNSQELVNDATKRLLETGNDFLRHRRHRAEQEHELRTAYNQHGVQQLSLIGLLQQSGYLDRDSDVKMVNAPQPDASMKTVEHHQGASNNESLSESTSNQQPVKHPYSRSADDLFGTTSNGMMELTVGYMEPQKLSTRYKNPQLHHYYRNRTTTSSQSSNSPYHHQQQQSAVQPEFVIQDSYRIEAALPSSNPSVASAITDDQMGSNRQTTTITILKRLVDQTYFGELSISCACSTPSSASGNINSPTFSTSNSPSSSTSNQALSRSGSSAEVGTLPARSPTGSGSKTTFFSNRSESQCNYGQQQHHNHHHPIRSRFFLGTAWDARIYLSQYLDMITEGGKRSMRVSRFRDRSPGSGSASTSK